MEKATISQLKNQLSAYLDKVKAGQTVLILDRDQPIARIEKISGAAMRDDRVSRLERAGLLKRPVGKLSISGLRSAAPRAAKSVVQALIEERAESR